MIEINNLTESKVNEGLIKKTIEHILRSEGFSRTAGVSVAFLGPGRMRKLNKAFLRKNRATDVLSFAESKVSFGKFKIGPLERIQGLGEIVICPREVKKNAKRVGAGLEKEILRVVVHGVLHLIGYNHEKQEKEAQAMQEKEALYLTQFSNNR